MVLLYYLDCDATVSSLALLEECCVVDIFLDHVSTDFNSNMLLLQTSKVKLLLFFLKIFFFVVFVDVQYAD